MWESMARVRRRELSVLYRWMQRARTRARAEKDESEEDPALVGQMADLAAISGRAPSRACVTASGCKGTTVSRERENAGMGTHLAVDVLQSTHENSVEVLGEVDGLEVDLGLDDRLVDLLLVLETIDVLASVGVDVLETFGELVVQSVDETDDAASDGDSGFGRGGCTLVEVVVVGRLLCHDVLAFEGKEVEEEVEVGVGTGPRVEGHVRVDGGVVVEEGGDEGEEDADALVRTDSDEEELLQDLDLLRSVRVLREYTCQSQRRGIGPARRTLRPRASRTCARALKIPSDEMVMVLPLLPTVWKSSSSASPAAAAAFFFFSALAGASGSAEASRSNASGSWERQRQF